MSNTLLAVHMKSHTDLPDILCDYCVPEGLSFGSEAFREWALTFMSARSFEIKFPNYGGGSHHAN